MRGCTAFVRQLGRRNNRRVYRYPAPLKDPPSRVLSCQLVDIALELRNPDNRGSQKCRLLYLVGELREGGSERQLYYLLKTINRARYRPEVAVWTFRPDDPYVSRIQ